MRTLLFLFAMSGIVCQAKATDELLTFRYLSRGPVTNQDYLLSRMVFWVTNHTTNRLSLTLGAIEIKAGSYWLTQTNLTRPLLFQPTNAAGTPRTRKGEVAKYRPTQRDIDPRGEGLVWAPGLSPKLPPGTTWRVRGNIQPVLAGWADTAARVKAYSGEVLEHMQGRTNGIPSRPGSFSNRLTFYGSPVQFVGPAIVEQ